MAKKEAPATTQAEYDKAWEEVKSGKQSVPSFDDMGPFPVPPADVKKVKKEKTSVEVERKAKGGMIKSSASKRADGCAVKGKTKGRII